jgi:hypothetical protein
VLGSRELLCLFGRISGTFVRYSSLSELCQPGQPASCRMRVDSLGWWSNIIFLLARRGVFQGGSARHVDVASSRGSTRQVVAAYSIRVAIFTQYVQYEYCVMIKNIHLALMCEILLNTAVVLQRLLLNPAGMSIAPIQCSKDSPQRVIQRKLRVFRKTIQ